MDQADDLIPACIESCGLIAAESSSNGLLAQVLETIITAKMLHSIYTLL